MYFLFFLLSSFYSKKLVCYVDRMLHLTVIWEKCLDFSSAYNLLLVHYVIILMVLFLAYLFLLNCDPNADVRRAVLSSIAPSTKTLTSIIGRTRDVKGITLIKFSCLLALSLSLTSCSRFKTNLRTSYFAILLFHGQFHSYPLYQKSAIVWLFLLILHTKIQGKCI